MSLNSSEHLESYDGHSVYRNRCYRITACLKNYRTRRLESLDLQIIPVKRLKAVLITPFIAPLIEPKYCGSIS